jgi:hypothetical protein
MNLAIVRHLTNYYPFNSLWKLAKTQCPHGGQSCLVENNSTIKGKRIQSTSTQSITQGKTQSQFEGEIVVITASQL